MFTLFESQNLFADNISIESLANGGICAVVTIGFGIVYGLRKYYFNSLPETKSTGTNNKNKDNTK